MTPLASAKRVARCQRVSEQARWKQRGSCVHRGAQAAHELDATNAQLLLLLEQELRPTGVLAATDVPPVMQ